MRLHPAPEAGGRQAAKIVIPLCPSWPTLRPMFNHDDLPGPHALRYLRAHLRDVPDFPKPGILFKDITPLLAEPRAFHITLDLFAERFIGEHVDVVVGVESRGFIFGGALAAR